MMSLFDVEPLLYYQDHTQDVLASNTCSRQFRTYCFTHHQGLSAIACGTLRCLCKFTSCFSCCRTMALDFTSLAIATLSPGARQLRKAFEVCAQHVRLAVRHTMQPASLHELQCAGIRSILPQSYATRGRCRALLVQQ